MSKNNSMEQIVAAGVGGPRTVGATSINPAGTIRLTVDVDAELRSGLNVWAASVTKDLGRTPRATEVVRELIAELIDNPALWPSITERLRKAGER